MQEDSPKPKPKHKLYDAARDLFITTGYTCKEISKILDISEQSLSRWRKSDKWDEERAIQKTSPALLKTQLRDELISISEGKKPSIDADSLLKTFKVYSEFDGRMSTSIVAAVFKEYDHWLAEVEPSEWEKSKELHKQYLRHKAESESLK